MCGVAGILNLDQRPVSSHVLRAMTQAIAHRGPDGEGQWIEGAIGLGHRRLAIIDLSPTGAQPMQTADGRFVISYNGEIYNYRELRAELETQGRRFNSSGDTEVLLQAIAAWGLDALRRLNGMFAFALWDRKERKLTLARDRYGIKPLYYWSGGSQLLFASESKAFRAVPNVDSHLDPEGLLEYFTFQNFFTDRTLLKGVRILPAGCYLTTSPEAGFGTKPRLTRYWDYSFQEPETAGSEAEYQEELDHLVQQAVKRQLVSDVDIGAYLSGGLDSGTVTAIAAESLTYMRTFTCGFDLSSVSGMELQYDERAASERMSYLFRTEHYEMVLKSGDMERVLPKLTWHLEEPRVGQSYPNYYVAQLASKFNKVVLAGTGGDEIFGGYPWRYYRAVVNQGFEEYVDKYYDYWQRLIPNSVLKRVFAPIWSDVQGVSTRDIFRDMFNQHAERLTRPEDYVNHSLYLEAKTFLHGLLTVEDKLSMAHSLETRVPFLDNDLVDFAMKLPVRMKLGKLDEVVALDENALGRKTAAYFHKARDGKMLLRNVMLRHIPQEVVDREKQGFSGPDASWFKGQSIDFVRNILFDDQAEIYRYLDPKPLRALIGDHLDGRENRRLLIWSLINVEYALRQQSSGQLGPTTATRSVN
ncbi:MULTISPECIES: asparagine synthase (glutamine-hydrolyzing) [Bradyrhizobium]|uniref:asparagine synthase (glutamine-hydrolyzing) n=1 Tax=Bradyrhizobium brasilense TaxID=1419277 RepID=A0ABY8JT55_9BRAD|nr:MULTISPECIES: asparagine synthase (glutamine-hydrolyzing) [Bradyrhizobium]WFU66912.1 asparagine synthase (glutamine-hydrolyzing) [Bradyrhizobium brasilense]